ncbi:MAG: SIS domain-containing protein [Candidatus Latescibacteria bacterium]|jgi:glutamine---fructose-6-phosphate transaminase (isomerizing)|nr:SIS domain-containing protein [Candidatus Latescibacterota bacterium]
MDNTRFVREIKEQPLALRTVADYYSGKEGSALLTSAAEEIASKKKIVFTGMGTSLYAPYILTKELAGLPFTLEILDAGELLHFGLDGIRGDEIIIAVSQSGESIETRRVVEVLKERVPVISIVNNHSSYMGKNSRLVLPINAGEEASISNKTYTNTLAVLFLLSTCLNRNNPEADIKLLRTTSDIMEQNLEDTGKRAVQAADYFGDLASLHMIARGSDLVTARQWALVIKEGACIFSEALSGGLFRHGPFEIAGEGHSAVFIISDGNEPDLTWKLAEEIQALGSRVAVVSDRKYDNSKILNIVVESISPRYFPLLCAPFMELFVHETAKRKGKEAGVFHSISKVTSRE